MKRQKERKEKKRQKEKNSFSTSQSYTPVSLVPYIFILNILNPISMSFPQNLHTRLLPRSIFPWAVVLCTVLFCHANVISSDPPPPFGHQMLQYFGLDPTYTNLNHGSYGSPPKSVTASAAEWEAKVELNPDKWFRYEYFDAMDKLRARIADYIGAKKEDVVFVPNASNGMNAVLRSLKLKSNEKILFLNTAYRMVLNTLQFLEEFDDDQLVMANVSWPLSDQQVGKH